MDGATLDDVVSLTECADALSVHKSTISRQVKAGVIPNHGTIEAPRVSIAEARAARAAQLDQAKQRGPQSPLFAGAPETTPAPPDEDLARAAEEAVAESEGRAPSQRGPTFAEARTSHEGFKALGAKL